MFKFKMKNSKFIIFVLLECFFFNALPVDPAWALRPASSASRDGTRRELQDEFTRTADGGAKELYAKAVAALREAAGARGREGDLERYDEALRHFGKFLEADPSAHHFLTIPFAEQGPNRQISISGGRSIEMQTIHVPSLLQAIQFVLNSPTPTPEKRNEVEEVREEVLEFLLVSTQLWPVTKEREKPEGVRELVFMKHPDTRLFGYFFEAQDRSRKVYPTVVMLAPFSQSVLVLRGYARFLQENYHANVLLLEMRHHGESGGDFSSLGHLESGDLSWVIEQLAQNPDLRVDKENIIGCGLSIGAQIWLLAEKEGLVKPRALILDTLPLFGRNAEGKVDWETGWDAFSFGLPQRLASSVMELHRRILYYHLHQNGIHFGEDDTFPDPLDLLRQVKTPSLVLVENLDRWAPARRASDTFEAVHEAGLRSLPDHPLLLATGINGGHARGFVDDPERYQSAVRLFLNRVLPQWAIRPDRPGISARDGAERGIEPSKYDKELTSIAKLRVRIDKLIHQRKFDEATAALSVFRKSLYEFPDAIQIKREILRAIDLHILFIDRSLPPKRDREQSLQQRALLKQDTMVLGGVSGFLQHFQEIREVQGKVTQVIGRRNNLTVQWNRWHHFQKVAFLLKGTEELLEAFSEAPGIKTEEAHLISVRNNFTINLIHARELEWALETWKGTLDMLYSEPNEAAVRAEAEYILNAGIKLFNEARRTEWPQSKHQELFKALETLYHAPHYQFSEKVSLAYEKLQSQFGASESASDGAARQRNPVPHSLRDEIPNPALSPALYP